jgi:membrane-bound inhibitor of C-type lysozyme
MRFPLAAAVPAALLMLGTLFTAGCHKAPDHPPKPAATPESASPAGTLPEPIAVDASTPSAAAMPEGVLRAYFWECDNGVTLVMQNLLEEKSIGLEMHGETRKLPQVVAASGVRYSDGDFTFWTKGDTATLQRGSNPQVACREVRARSLVEDARARGLLYRGTGNEPGWTVEVGPNDRLQFVTDYGAAKFEFTGAAVSNDDGTPVYCAKAGDDVIKVRVKQEACADDMAGTNFDHSMVVEHGGKTYRGCAVAL